MTTNIGSLAVSLSLDAANFNGSIDRVNRNLGAMGSEMRAVRALGTQYGNSLEGLRSKKDILTRSVGASSIKLEEERRKYDALVASGTASEAQLERQARRVNEAQTQYNRLTTELSEVEEALRRQSSAWQQYGERMTAAGTKLKAVGDGMTKVGKDLSTKVTAPIVALSSAAFKAAVDFESAFAGVRKTVDATEEEFAALSDGIRGMAKEIPAAATEIAGVAEAAGQLGIKKEAILSFTRTMVDLGVATNMSSEEAATGLARLANITNMNQKDFDRLGSSIVALGNNFATTEKEIVEMGLRLAGAGAQVGMSEADILGLSTALTSVGINAEMGGSAFSRVMVQMQLATSTGFTKVQKLSKDTGLSLRDMQMMASHSGKAFGNMAEDMGMTKKELTAIVKAGVELEGFSKIAGMTGDQFRQAFEKDAVGAIGSFIDGLANAEDTGDTAINMLQEMGITSVLLRDSLLRAGGASELFGSAIDLSNSAWDENNALTKEAEERYKTTASQMKILWNQIVDVGISMGNILIPLAKDAMEAFKPLVEKFAQLDKEQQKNILKMAGLAAAVGPVLVVVGSLTSTLGSTLLIAGKLSTSIAGAGGLAASVTALAVPVGIAVAAIAAVGVAGYGLYKVLNQTSIPEIEIFGNKVSENTKKAVSAFTVLTDKATVQLNLLKWSGTKVTKEMAEEMIGTYGEMGKTILDEMKSDHATQLETARGYFTNSKTLTEEEKKLLSTIMEGHATREKAVQDALIQYNSIIQKASDERRGITSLEQETLDRLQREMMETGVKHLSESEEESLIILERLKLESGKINAEQAIDTAARAREAKDAVIEEAEKKYEEALGLAILLKEDGSAEALEAANAIITEAERTRDDTIGAANGQYDEVIRIAKERGGEYVTETELHLGQVMTLWQKASWSIGVDVGAMSVNIVKDLQTMAVDGAVWLVNLKNDGITAAAGLASGITTAMKELPGLVYGILIDTAVEAAKSIVDFFKVGEDIVAGLKEGMIKKSAEVAAESFNLGKSMVTSISKSIGRQSPAKEFIKVAEDAGEGVVVGFKNSESKVSNAAAKIGKIMADVTRENADEVSKIADEAEKKRTEIQNDYAKKRAELDRKTAQSSQTALKTSKNKKGEIVTTGTQRVHNIRANASAQLIKLNDDEQKKLAKINEKAWNDMQKKEQEVSSERLSSIKKFISDKRDAEEISLIDEAEIWKVSVKNFKDGTEGKRIAQLELRDANRAVDQEMLESGIAYIDEKKRLGKISLQDEIRLLDELSTHFESHSMKYETIQKRKAQVIKQVNDDVTKINETFSAKMIDINKKMTDGILKINEELANKTKSINERLAADTLKANEDLAVKSQAITDRLIADQQRLNDEIAKAVDDRAKALVNFAGLFDNFDMSPKQSGDELLGNLKSQVDGFKSWEEEINSLSSKAINEGLLAELREMGPKALPQLLALNSMTEEQLEEYSALYQEKSALARAKAEKEMAGMKEDTQRRLEELRAIANVELEQLKMDTYMRVNEMRMMADAELAQLRNDASVRINEMRTTANTELNVLKTEWVKEINNITKATDEEFKSLTQVGKNAGQNLLDGLASMESSLVAKAQSIAAAVNAALQSALGGMDSVSSSVGGSKSGGSPAATSKSYQASVTNNYYVPVVSPADQARKQLQTQRQLGMEF